MGPQHVTQVRGMLNFEKDLPCIWAKLGSSCSFLICMNITLSCTSCKICIVSQPQSSCQKQRGLPSKTSHTLFFRPWSCKYLIMCGTLLSRVTLWSLLDCSHEHNYMHFKCVPDLDLELSIKWPLWSCVRHRVHPGCAWSLCRRHNEKMLLAKAKEWVDQINF